MNAVSKTSGYDGEDNFYEFIDDRRADGVDEVYGELQKEHNE